MRGEAGHAGRGGRPRPGRPSRLQLFASRSSLHGLSRICAAAPPPSPSSPSPPSPSGRALPVLRRLLWALCFVGSLALLALVCAERVAHFLAYPHVTKLDEVAVANLTFPAVTLCNLNEFRFSKITRNDLYHVGALLALLDARAQLRADAESLAALREKADFRGFKARPFDMAEFYNRTGHDLAEMLWQCSFRGAHCGAQNFTVIFTRLGKCYTFNSGAPGYELLTTAKGGTGNGLELMLNIQQDEYLPVWGKAAGVKVQIHSQDEPPNIDQLGFGVAPGFQTFVSCQQQRLFYLPPPWGVCKPSPTESTFFANYSIAACRIDCETRYLAENCNCRMVHMPGNADICTPEQYKECADPALDFLVEKDTEFCSCRMPCQTVRYGKELSMVKIPSKASAKYLAKKYNRSEQYIMENLLVLDIFFETLNYETIEQRKAYEVAGLLGDIGGQMGLFIGASLLTILEIFDYLYEVLRDKLLTYYQSRKQVGRNHSDHLEYMDLPRSPQGAVGPHLPRVPVRRCTATRPATDTPRTCYLVTRL
ncbi:hypothetical protein JRQ81_018440 [Phrynocephalus forsythii]|uniref:Acid-sensing ion channel 3 n=1 Tax=Phrynocephalus forsythii TaxID=171643 RepID=A0A9Q0XNP3_9SAUR|nr:hypothetical protein JRQ81_018440 [Phrynocephalus forsythii]